MQCKIFDAVYYDEYVMHQPRSHNCSHVVTEKLDAIGHPACVQLLLE